jgi:dTDP-4-amino-4,6-dideoxygalactose transaminase
MKTIQLADLASQNLMLEKEMIEAFQRVLRSGHYILGEEVNKFEEEFSSYSKSKFTVSCSSGTSALEIALRVLGIGAGDEVILPSLSFVATLKAVLAVGARPVLADVLPDTYLIDSGEVLKKISVKTKAIIPVHLHGKICDLQSINIIAKKNDLFVVEDFEIIYNSLEHSYQS